MYQKLYETNEKSYLECIQIVHQNEYKTMKQLSSRLFELWKHFIHCDEIDMIKLLMIRFINTTIFNKMVESDVKMQNKFDKNTNIHTANDRKQCMYFAAKKISTMIFDSFHGWGNDKRIVFDESTKQIKFLDFDYFLAIKKIEYQYNNHQKQLSGFNQQAKYQCITPKPIIIDKRSKTRIVTPIVEKKITYDNKIASNNTKNIKNNKNSKNAEILSKNICNVINNVKNITKYDNTSKSNGDIIIDNIVIENVNENIDRLKEVTLKGKSCDSIILKAVNNGFAKGRNTSIESYSLFASDCIKDSFLGCSKIERDEILGNITDLQMKQLLQHLKYPNAIWKLLKCHKQQKLAEFYDSDGVWSSEDMIH